MRSVSAETRSETTVLSREQSLREFRRVLSDALDLDAVAQVAPRRIDEYRRPLPVPFSGVDGRALTTYLRTYVAALAGGPAETFFDAYEFDLERSGVVLDTAFARKLQKRIALDLMAHVVSPHATKAFHALAGHALLQYRRLVEDDMSRADGYSGDHAEQLHGVSRIMSVLYVRRPVGFADMILRHAEATKRGSEVTGMTTFSSTFPLHVFGTLLRLPYREMLVNHRAGRPMLEGVRFREGMPVGTRRTGEADRRVPHGMF